MFITAIWILKLIEGFCRNYTNTELLLEIDFCSTEKQKSPSDSPYSLSTVVKPEAPARPPWTVTSCNVGIQRWANALGFRWAVVPLAGKESVTSGKRPDEGRL